MSGFEKRWAKSYFDVLVFFQEIESCQALKLGWHILIINN